MDAKKAAYFLEQAQHEQDGNLTEKGARIYKEAIQEAADAAGVDPDALGAFFVVFHKAHQAKHEAAFPKSPALREIEELLSPTHRS
ncbi:hypothetical protein ACFY2K_26345 [Kitasatospora sp. NPDC001309]|uniref:hypothetical protein n=1 Tax=Kitasatospora sp. NPDC001309 TaxID=3364013 RepID=UPI0036CE0A08